MGEESEFLKFIVALIRDWIEILLKENGYTNRGQMKMFRLLQLRAILKPTGETFSLFGGYLCPESIAGSQEVRK